MVTPLENYTSLRSWLATVLGRNPPPKALTIVLRIGATEETVDRVTVEATEDTEAVITRINTALVQHTQHFEPVRRAVVRIRCLGENGRPVYNAGSDIVAINDLDDGQNDMGLGGGGGGSLQAATGADELMRNFLASGGTTTQLPVAAAYMPQFTLLALLENNRMMFGRFEAMQNVQANTISRLAQQNETLQTNYFGAQLASRAAQLEADAEKKGAAIAAQDRTVKRELVTMFSQNLSKGLDLLFASASGLPPDDPAMQQAFLMGFVKKNPERAAEIAKQLGLGGGPLELLEDPSKLKPLVFAFAEKDPERAAELAADLFSGLEEVFARKSAERDAAEKAGAAQK